MNSAVTSRRRLLVGGAAAVTATAAAQVVGSASAQAAPVTYTPNAYPTTLVPNYKQLHYMNRLGCGYSPTTFEQMRAAGSVSTWLNKQLSTTPPAESPIAQAVPSWFPNLEHSPTLMWSNVVNRSRVSWDYSRDLANLTMLRRIYSTRPVFENLVEFWSNHLHIYANADLAWVQRPSYDQVIRKHALGRFEDMLVEAALSRWGRTRRRSCPATPWTRRARARLTTTPPSTPRVASRCLSSPPPTTSPTVRNWLSGTSVSSR